MADYDQIMTALRNAHEAGDTTAAARLAQMALEARSGQSRDMNLDIEMATAAARAAGRDESRGGPMGRVNRGMAGLVDAVAGPVNMGANWAIRQGAGALGIENPPQFVENPAETTMRAVGIDMPERDPETMGARFQEGVGEAAASLLPLSMIGRLAAGSTSVAGGAAARMTEPFVRNPVTMTAAELSAGGGARVGGELAGRASEDEQGQRNMLASFGGEMAGAVLGGLAPMAGLRGPGQAAVRAGARWIGRNVLPMTEQGARVIAGERLRGLSADPYEIGDRAVRETVSDLTPAQRTGEPGLMALERTIAERDPALLRRLNTRMEENVTKLLNAAREIGGNISPARTRSFFNEEIDRAMLHARDVLDDIRPEQRASVSSQIVRQNLEEVLAAAEAQERRLWDQVPPMATVPTDAARQATQQAVDTTGRARMVDIPTEARQLLLGADGLGDSTSVRELHALYSRLRQTAREAMGQQVPNENRARIANNIADAILVDLGARSDNVTEIGRAINNARMYSRSIADTFGQGSVGRLLGRTRAGGDAVDPAAALATTMGPAGEAGMVGARDVRAGLEFTGDARAASEGQQAMEEWLRSRFVDYVAPRGDIQPNRVTDFLRRNRETMDMFPGLRDRFEGAAQAARTAEELRSSIGGQFAQDTPARSLATRIFGPDVENPAAAARALVREAQRDATGEALSGLKTAVVDHITGAARDGAERSGRDMARAMQRNQAAIRQILSREEYARLQRIVDEFQILDTARAAGSVGDPVPNRPHTLVSYLARVVAARQGAQFGAGTSGASLQAAGMASKRMQDILRRLTGDRATRLLTRAIEDGDLMRTLSLDMRNPRNQATVIEALERWAFDVGLGATLGATSAQIGGEQ